MQEARQEKWRSVSGSRAGSETGKGRSVSVSKDKCIALNAGMSGLEGMIQGFGETSWCVSLGKKISVVPEEMISAEVPWITVTSYYRATEELKRRALAGDKMGNLADVISKLTKTRSASNK